MVGLPTLPREMSGGRSGFQFELLFSQPSLGAEVGADGVDPAISLEFAVKNREGGSWGNTRPWLCPFGVLMKLHFLPGRGRIRHDADSLPLTKEWGRGCDNRRGWSRHRTR